MNGERRRRFARSPALAVAATLALLVLPTPFTSSAQAADHVNVVTVEGSINPASADYLIEAIARSEDEGAKALLIELDTPGGLVASTKDIIQAMLNSRVPTIVYVTPRGAWAASAGTFITVAANVAAMSPGSSIGAAHPVGVGGGGGGGQGDEEGKQTDVAMEKAENLLAAYVEGIAKQRDRNVEWVVEAVRNSVAVSADEALELGVIDLVAGDRQELFAAIEGWEVEVAGKTVVLELEGSPAVPLGMSTLQGLFNFLADPNVAILLVFGGLMGLYIEFNNPGLIAPGAAGAVSLLLAGIAFQILPFSWVGLMLVMLGLVLLIAEIFVASFGLLFAAGVGCLLLGGSMVFTVPDMSDLTVSFWSVLVPAVFGLSAFGALVAFLVGRSLLRKRESGIDEMIGLVGRCATALDPEGRVFVRGEYWNVVADEDIGEGEAVEVTAVDGLRLRVRRARAAG